MKPAIVSAQAEHQDLARLAAAAARSTASTAACNVAPLTPDTQKSAVSARASLAIRGGAWSISGYVFTHLLRTATTLVLAHYFLGPEAFGIVGLVTVFLSGLTMFSELGIVVSIVQHPRGDHPDFLDTAFSIQAVRGLLIWLAAALAAYPLSLFYEQPLIFPLLLVAAASEVVRGFASTSAWTFKRHLQLRKITLVTIAAESTSFALTVVWALLSPSIWVLVVRPLATATVLTLGSHFIAERSVRFRWEPSAATQILKFGGWISLSTAAFFLAGQGERLIFGKFVTLAELGCFSLALVIALTPAAGIRELVSQVFLPMIAQSVRTSQAQTTQDFRRARLIFFVIALSAAIGFLLLAKPVIALILNPEYSMAGWMLQLLGLRVALELYSAPASALILARGASRYTAFGNATRLVLMLLGLTIAFAKFGIFEAVASLVLAQAISYFPIVMGVHRLVPGAGGAELRWYTLLLAVIAGCWWALEPR